MFRSLTFVLLLVTTTTLTGAPAHETSAFVVTQVHISASAGLAI